VPNTPHPCRDTRTLRKAARTAHGVLTGSVATVAGGSGVTRLVSAVSGRAPFGSTASQPSHSLDVRRDIACVPDALCAALWHAASVLNPLRQPTAPALLRSSITRVSAGQMPLLPPGIGKLIRMIARAIGAWREKTTMKIYVVRANDDLLPDYFVTAWAWRGGKRIRLQERRERQGTVVVRAYQSAVQAARFFAQAGGTANAEVWAGNVELETPRLISGPSLAAWDVETGDVVSGPMVWQVSYRRRNSGPTCRRFFSVQAARAWRSVLRRHGCIDVQATTFTIAGWAPVPDIDAEVQAVADGLRARRVAAASARYAEHPARQLDAAVLAYITGHPGEGVKAAAEALQLPPKDVENSVLQRLMPSGRLRRLAPGRYEATP
jgi:hypothetical protein